MKTIKKISASLLLFTGILILMAAAYAPFDHDSKKEDKISGAIACLLFGLPVAGAGGWIFWGLRRDWQKQEENRILSTFHQQLEAGNGHITTLQFALATQLPATSAKQYLDRKAQEFNGSFKVNDEGVVIYYFPEYLQR